MTISDEIVSINDDLLVAGGNLFVECVDGSCKTANGYVINNDKVYKVSNGVGTLDDEHSPDSVIDSSIETEADCSDDNVGKILKDKSAVCLKPGKSIKMEKNSMKYLMKGGNVLITGTDSGPVKSGEGYVVIDGFISEGKYLNEDNKKKKIFFFN